MSILVTGSTGKTSLRVVRHLQAANIPFLLATRRPASEFPNIATVKLDWFDNTTYTNAFAEDRNISAVYLVPPESMEPAPYMNEFVDLAVENGVKKFVLCGGTSTVKSGVYVGKVWSHLEEIGVSYGILRPSWFSHNFSEGQHEKTIKEQSIFYTAAGDGKIPFVSADDIAIAAVSLLTGKKSMENRDYLILGPELLTHDDVAAILSEVVDRPIKHVRRTQDEMVDQYKRVGVNELFANFLPYLEDIASRGSEEKFQNDFEILVGRKPISFSEWAEEEAKNDAWA